MKHDPASERLLELAYGDLSAREARDVEAHAAGCERCREELAGIRETRSLMAKLPAEPAPERGEGIVMAAARAAAELRGRERRSILPPWLWAGSIGAVAAAAVAVVSWQLTREPLRQSLRPQESELMGSAKSAPAVAAPQPAAARAPRPAAQPTVAMREEPPAKREPMAKAAPMAAMDAKGGIGFAEAGRDRAEEAEAPRALQARSRADGAGGAGGYAMADAERVASGAAPARSTERKVAAAPAAASPEPARPHGVETRVFADCLGERRRIVERDAAGRVIRYVRIGEDETIEHRYAADGRLVAAAAFEGGERHALPLDAPGLVRDARDAGIDAPPRCGP